MADRMARRPFGPANRIEGDIFDEANEQNTLEHTMKNLLTYAIAGSCLAAFVPEPVTNAFGASNPFGKLDAAVC